MKKVFVLTALVVGCSGSELAPEATQASPGCVVGQVIECPCASGVKGTQTCGKDGYDACQCPADKPRTTPSVVPTQDSGNQIPPDSAAAVPDVSVVDSQTPDQDAQPGAPDGASEADVDAQAPDVVTPPADAGADIEPTPDATMDVVTPPPQDAGIDAPTDARPDANPYDPNSYACRGVWGVDGFAGVKGKFPPGPCAAVQGNLLVTYTYGECGRPLTVQNCGIAAPSTCYPGGTYTYDTAGNLATYQSGGGGTYSYSNNGKKIVAAERRSQYTGEVMSHSRFSYDTSGKLIKTERDASGSYPDGGAYQVNGTVTVKYMNGTVSEVLYGGACTTGYDGIINYTRGVDIIVAKYWGEPSNRLSIMPDWKWDNFYTDYLPSVYETTKCVTTAAAPHKELQYKLNYAQKPIELKYIAGRTTKWYIYEYDTKYREIVRSDYEQDPTQFGVKPTQRIETKYDVYGNIVSKGTWEYDYSCWYK